jgi:hypothetical protein
MKRAVTMQWRLKSPRGSRQVRWIARVELEIERSDSTAQRFTHALRDDGRIVVQYKNHGPLKPVRSRDEPIWLHGSQHCQGGPAGRQRTRAEGELRVPVLECSAVALV